MDLRKSLKIENALNHTKGLKKANHKKKNKTVVESTVVENTKPIEVNNDEFVESPLAYTEERLAEPFKS